MDLRCPSGCAEGRFEALNARLIVDAAGRYLEHDAQAATYVCERCQSVSIDVAAAAQAMHRGDTVSQPSLVCPACGLDLLPPEDDPFAALVECPACETRFAVEEGMPQLHGESATVVDAGPDDA